MKKVLAGLTVLTLLAIGAVAFAHGPGGWGYDHMMGRGYGGHMMGSGYGGHMMGSGYGGHMMGSYGGYDQKFLDETADLRKELHTTKFLYFEALRDPETDTKSVTKLEREIRDLQEKIHEKAPRTAYGRFGGYGCGF